MTSSAPQRQSRSFTAIAACILTLAIGLAYAGTFSAPFEFDDIEAIRNNPTIRHLSDLRAVLAPPHAQGSTVGGRPILNLSFALNYAVSGTAVWSYHLVNIAIHLGCALLLFGIARRLLSRLAPLGADGAAPPDRLALAIASVWALHPLQTEAVTYLSQRAESLASLFYLLAVDAFLRGTTPADSADASRPGRSETPERGTHIAAPNPGVRRTSAWLAVSVLACLAGVATKEIVATAPLLLLVLDRTIVAGTFRDALRKRWAYYLALVASWLLAGALALSTHNRGGTAGFDTGVTVWSYLLTQAQAIPLYLKLVVWPAPLVFDYGTHLAGGLADVWPYGLFVIALLATGLACLFWRGSEQPSPRVGVVGAGFALVAFFVLLAPSSSFVPIGSQTMAEHRLYLPLAAVVALVLVAANRWLGRRAVFGMVAVALLCGGLTWRRNAMYRSDLTLWADTVAHAPGNARAHNNLGNALVTTGDFAEARSHYETAVRLQPDYPDAQSNLGHVLVQLGRPEEALVHAELAANSAPDSVNVLTNYGLALSRVGRSRDAIAAYRKALRISPSALDARYDLGNAYYHAGDFHAAVGEYNQVLAQEPARVDARFNLAYALLQLNRPQEALLQFESVLRYDPNSADAHLEAGNLQVHFGRPVEAVAQFEAALRLKPDSVVAREQLEQARRQLHPKQP